MFNTALWFFAIIGFIVVAIFVLRFILVCIFYDRDKSIYEH